MKERPILMNAPMVRATLADLKLQTRRAMPSQVCEPGRVAMAGPGYCEIVNKHGVHIPGFHCPFGQPGDRLWVRETWHGTKGEPNVYGNGCLRYYRADYEDHPAYPQPFRWTPSIHMPRWASRITLEVTGVRVERLQAISEADARAEGVLQWAAELAMNPKVSETDIQAMAEKYGTGSLRGGYAALWEEINGPGSWDANPWVWVVEFKRLEAA